MSEETEDELRFKKEAELYEELAHRARRKQYSLKEKRIKCCYCGKMMDDPNGCPSNPFSDYHVSGES